jgi:hypothetical protein
MHGGKSVKIKVHILKSSISFLRKKCAFTLKGPAKFQI